MSNLPGVDVRGSRHPVILGAAAALTRFNGRHPWSHNDHFHPWILRNLPERRRLAIDIGCGQGALVTRLAPHFDRVHGTDLDAGMRTQASARCVGLTNVTIDDAQLADLDGPVDLVTMVAVLHHLDASHALTQIARLLAPGGRFLAVGLAPPVTLRDTAWDLLSAVTNPVIGLIRHPHPLREGVGPAPFPVAEPRLSFDGLHDLVRAVMPGATMRHRLAFRHTIRWTRPD